MKNIHKSTKALYDNNYLIDLLKEKLVQKEKQLSYYANKIFELEERFMVVNWFVQNMNNAKDTFQLSELVCDEIKRLLFYDFCCVLIYDCESQKFHIKTTSLGKSGNVCKRIFKSDLKKYTQFLNKIISKRPQHLSERIEAFIKEFDANKYVFPIVTNDGYIYILYAYRELPICEKSDINAIDIICDNYKLSLKNLKLYKQLKESNLHKTEFIANVTHEFKTPLNAIIGFAELLKNADVNTEKSSQFINNIVKNSHHLLKLIEDILDVSRMELNSVDLIYESTNSKKLIEETAYILEGLSLAKNLEVNLNLIDVDVLIDKRRYKQVVYNLLNNAIKFSFENGKIDIFTYIENGNFYFEIIDEGVGIPIDASDRIFDMFSQGCKDVLKKEKGHGVGLFICKRIVNLHNGDIFYEPKSPSGAIFRFYVPYNC